MIREQNAGTTDGMDIRELTSNDLEGVTGGWELDQLKSQISSDGTNTSSS